MKAHLLYEAADFDIEGPLPPRHEDLVQDLELTTLFQAMARGDKFLFEVCRRVVLTSLQDPEEIEYRQAVLADCQDRPEIVRELYAIAVRALEDKRGIWGFWSRHPTSILSGAVRQLEAFVVRLKELRRVADEHQEEFRSAGLRRLLRSLQDDLDDDYLSTVEVHLRQLRFRHGVLVSMRLDRDNSGVDYVLRSAVDRGSGWKGRLGIGARSSYSFTVPPRDEAGGQALAEMTNRGINLVANAAAQSADHIASYFTMLRVELAFYLGCLNLHEQLDSKHVAHAFPAAVPAPEGALACTALRDVSLALQAEGEVVGNDVQSDGRSLMLITGSNSGGKSTFLRSVGLAQLMMQSGMFVAAADFRSSVASGLFTHFIREEDDTMTSGRLDEELRRMSSIAEHVRPGCWVLFNESFAATNEREGSEIGRQVVRALLESGIRVFFVTHQYDLASGFERLSGASALFLRAERREHGRRTYKVKVGEPLPTSFGMDLYRRVGDWLGEAGGTGDAGGPREVAISGSD